MKKLLCVGLILMLSLMSGCGTDGKTIMNVNVEGNITKTQSSGFIKICDEPIRLVYDEMTGVVYIKNYTYLDNCVFTAYYAPNGFPYRYNPESNNFEEIGGNK